MSETTGSVQLHRVLRAPVERVFKAFTDKSAMEAWSPPYGFTASIESMDVRVGGECRMSFTNFGTGNSHSFTVTYTEVNPPHSLKYIDRFDDPNLPGDLTVEIELMPVLCGTELRISQSGIPAAIPVEMCYLGWQESLTKLANLVEPDIPENG